ncbi:hypothetical protein JCM11641_004843 [Rhodosporidiobolus odoratus]
MLPNCSHSTSSSAPLEHTRLASRIPRPSPPPTTKAASAIRPGRLADIPPPAASTSRSSAARSNYARLDLAPPPAGSTPRLPAAPSLSTPSSRANTSVRIPRLFPPPPPRQGRVDLAADPVLTPPLAPAPPDKAAKPKKKRTAAQIAALQSGRGKEAPVRDARAGPAVLAPPPVQPPLVGLQMPIPVQAVADCDLYARGLDDGRHGIVVKIARNFYTHRSLDMLPNCSHSTSSSAPLEHTRLASRIPRPSPPPTTKAASAIRPGRLADIPPPAASTSRSSAARSNYARLDLAPPPAGSTPRLPAAPSLSTPSSRANTSVRIPRLFPPPPPRQGRVDLAADPVLTPPLAPAPPDKAAKPKKKRTAAQIAALQSGRGKEAPVRDARAGPAVLAPPPVQPPLVGLQMPIPVQAVADCDLYARGLDDGRHGIVVKIARNLWAVPPWDGERQIISRTTWHHLRQEAERTTCSCNPVPLRPCVHAELFQRHPPYYDDDDDILPLNEPSISLFLTHACGKRLHLSLSKAPDSASRKRVMVMQGITNIWRCSDCPNSATRACEHVERAQTYAIEKGQLDAAERTGARAEVAEALEAALEEAEDDVPKGSAVDSSVSFLPRGPPLALRFSLSATNPSPFLVSTLDANTSTISSPLSLPSLLKLGDATPGRCGGCSLGWDEYQREKMPTGARRTSKVTVYYENLAQETKVETVACPRCNGTIGPDLVNLGPFNLDNRHLFARELLDDFIFNATASETPFFAYVKASTKRYCGRNSEMCTVRVFRSAWYAYARLLQIGTGMVCPECGPEPRIVIADGHVTATAKKFATGKLQPPTAPVDRGGEIRAGVRSVALPCLIAEDFGWTKASEVEKLRRELADLATLQSPPSDFPNELGALVTGFPAGSTLAQALKEAVYKLHALPKGDLREAYRRFFKQVASEDMILQIFPPVAADELATFLSAPTPATSLPSIRLQQLVPFFLELTAAVQDMPAAVCPPALKVLLQQLYTRAATVFNQLLTNHTTSVSPATSTPPFPSPEDVFRTGVLAAQAQLRYRPHYPKLDAKKNGRKTDGDAGDGSCRKYFEQYGKKQGLAGGICGLWCPHGICIMYHTMPGAEGRNDVFAALLCYFSVAPEVVVYDYACQLAQYALVREPEFFRNTRFYIDEFHARGHAKCSAACSIQPAMRADPDLRAVNTSAAECAHSTLRRIRKSMRYMTEGHGILLMHTAIQRWNREKLEKMYVKRS